MLTGGRAGATPGIGGGGRLFRLLGTGRAGLVGDVGLASSGLGIGGGMAEKRGDVGRVGDGSVGGGGGGDLMTGGAWAWVSREPAAPG